jgi:hypothetical protein
LRIARRFSAGKSGKTEQVPEGRLKFSRPCRALKKLFKSDFYPFSSQTPGPRVTDFQPAVGDNGIDLCVRAEVCPPPKTALKAAPALFASTL